MTSLRNEFKELVKSKLFNQFITQGFWHAHNVDLVWRYNGHDVHEEADWLKDLWYLLKDEKDERQGDRRSPEGRRRLGVKGRCLEDAGLYDIVVKQRDALANALRIITAAYPDDPGTSDLDNEQPVTITLGDIRRVWAALARL